GSDRESNILGSRLACGDLRGGDSLGVWVETVNASCHWRDAEGKATVSTTQVEDAFSADEPLAAPGDELIGRLGAQRRRVRGENLGPPGGHICVAIAHADRAA